MMDTATKRSPLYRKFDLETTTFEKLNGYLVPMKPGDNNDELESLRKLAICDMSWLPRTGFKGRDSASWLTAHGVRIPEEINSLEVNEFGCLVIRLGGTEFLIISGPGQMGELAVRLRDECDDKKLESDGVQTYYLPRQDSHACLLLSGEYTPQLLAKLCAIDLRAHKFPNHAVVQTSVARLSAIIIRNDLSDLPAYMLLVDTASSEYLWDCIVDAGKEYDAVTAGNSSILAP